MNLKNKKRLSKTLSLALRHRPDKFDLTLDTQGWCMVDQLLDKFNHHGISIDRNLLEEIVKTSDKQRFAFSENGQSIRANQGHSISVELGYKAVAPPETLFHGTAEKNQKGILANGLQKRKRHHVHLSSDKDTAVKVGQRHGKVVVLLIQSQKMHEEGYLFYCSENGVWLTDEVPPRYIEILLA